MTTAWSPPTPSGGARRSRSAPTKQRRSTHGGSSGQQPSQWRKSMRKLYPCLWFDGQAEEAANFYVTLLPDSRVDKVWRSPADTPSGPAGMVLTVDFTLAGEQFQ